MRGGAEEEQRRGYEYAARGVDQFEEHDGSEAPGSGAEKVREIDAPDEKWRPGE